MAESVQALESFNDHGIDRERETANREKWTAISSRKRHTNWAPIVISIILCLIVFSSLTFGLSHLLPQIDKTRLETDLYVQIEALATALATGVIIGAGYLAFCELREVTESRHMDIADRLFVEMTNAANIEARSKVYRIPEDLPSYDLETLAPDTEAAAKSVLNSLDRVAFLTQANWIPDYIILPWMHSMIFKSWHKLEKFVITERKKRNEPTYFQFVGELAQRCQVWRRKYGIENKFTVLPEVNLVQNENENAPKIVVGYFRFGNYSINISRNK